MTILAVISYFTGDSRGGVIIGVIVLLSVLLRFFQENRADAAAAKLKAMINITATVVRGGQQREIPLDHLVPGDVVALAAGDMVPADVRVMAAKDLFISQASLTGESFPVEKFDAVETRAGAAPLELSNICFMGTNVESGSATAAVVTTGRSTYFGGMAHSILGRQPAEQLRPGRAALHLADDPLHGGHGAGGLSHQLGLPRTTGSRRSFSPWRWPSD